MVSHASIPFSALSFYLRYMVQCKYILYLHDSVVFFILLFPCRSRVLFIAFNNFITSQGWFDSVYCTYTTAYARTRTNAHMLYKFHMTQILYCVSFWMKWNKLDTLKHNLNPHTDTDKYNFRCNVFLVILISPTHFFVFASTSIPCW